MSKKQLTIALQLSMFVFGLHLGYGQSGDNFEKNVHLHHNQVRDFQSAKFENPSLMHDFSTQTFSDFSTSFNAQQSDLYLLQQGKKQHALQVGANSFKVLDTSTVVWGKVRYSNEQHKDQQWQSNMDPLKTGPYAMADSTKAATKLETYEFSAGFSKKYNGFDLGMQMSYKAAMSYRQLDPRPKNTSSELQLGVAGSYDLSKKYKIGAHLMGYKYKQNTSVSFVSELKRAQLYQLTGLGEWNYYFSSRVNKATFDQWGYKGSLGVYSTTNDTFYAIISLGKSWLDKNVSSNAEVYLINELDHNQIAFDVFKGFSHGAHFYGFKFNYTQNQSHGYDVLYSALQSSLEPLAKQKNYLKQSSIVQGKGIYSYQRDTYTLGIEGGYSYERWKEVKTNSLRAQQYYYHTFDAQLSYVQKLSNKSALVSELSFIHREVANASIQMPWDQLKASIATWLANDYRFYSSNFTDLGLNVQYNRQMNQQIGGFIGARLNRNFFEDNMHSTFYSLSVGVIF